MSEQQQPVVLIVDDVMENIQVVASHLRNEEYELLFATDGHSALDVVAEGRVDLILLDVMMPGLNGFETCRDIKKRPETAEIPVIFLTAKADTESIVNGFEAGGVDYITKPFNGPELLARVRTQLRLRQDAAALRNAMAAKDRFLSIIADEINTPFGGLQGMLAMLAREWRELPEDELDDYLEMARNAADGVGGLFSNLLSWSRLQNGLFGFQPRDLALGELLEETLELLQADAARKGVTVTLEVESAASVHGDPGMLAKVFENLLANAIKYSRRGGEVMVTAQQREDGARVRFLDRGVGVDEALLPHLFAMDRTTLKPGTDGESGGGLGLILSRALVEQHQGALTLRNRDDGEGVEARVSFPRHAA